MIRRLPRFFRFPLAIQWLHLRAWAWLCLYRLALWVLPFARWHRWTSRLTAVHTPHLMNERDVIDTSRAVRRMARLVPVATCLPQALAMQTLLAHQGQASDLKIGVAQSEQGSFIAHAWVELDQRVIIGNQHGLRRFTPLPFSEYPRS